MKTFVSFHDIVEGVKEETGISNLVNRYNEIGKLIVRAERDINPYAGHFILKTVKYKKATVNFSGTHIKIPTDFIEISALSDRIGKGKSDIEYLNSNNTHILLCNGIVNETAVLKYWAIQTDPEGNPFIPYTHYEAVVAFIVWKFYSQRTFQNDGNANVKENYKNIYEQFCRAARGFDFFPSVENLNNMRALNGVPSQYEVVMDDCSCACGSIEDNSGPEQLKKVWFWQEDSLSQEVYPENVTDSFLEDKLSLEYSQFTDGTYFTTAFVGRYGIAVKGGPKDAKGIVDALGSSIESSVTAQYFQERDVLVIISENYVSPGSFYLKLNE